MLLPEGIKRENNKMYEEVEIPPNVPMPIGFEEKPVYISELDEVSGTALDIQQHLCSHFRYPSQTFLLFTWADALLYMLSDAVMSEISVYELPASLKTIFGIGTVNNTSIP